LPEASECGCKCIYTINYYGTPGHRTAEAHVCLPCQDRLTAAEAIRLAVKVTEADDFPVCEECVADMPELGPDWIDATDEEREQQEAIETMAYDSAPSMQCPNGHEGGTCSQCAGILIEKFLGAVTELDEHEI
jgi:hypothetical protein